MKSSELQFRERLAVQELLGSQRGDLKTMEAYRRCFRQVRFTENDVKELGLKVAQITPQEARWAWNPTADLTKFAAKLNLEDQDAKALATLLQNHTGWSMDDLDWVEHLISDLTKERSDAQ